MHTFLLKGKVLERTWLYLFTMKEVRITVREDNEGMFCAHDSIAFKISHKPFCLLISERGLLLIRLSKAVKAALRYTEREAPLSLSQLPQNVVEALKT